MGDARKRRLSFGKRYSSSTFIFTSLRPRLGIILGLILAGLGWLLFEQARTASRAESVDGTRVILYFAGTILLAVLIGVVLVLVFLPAVGEAAGNFFFQPNQKLGPSRHDQARAALDRGDPEGALKAYRALLIDEPGDLVATLEVARLLSVHRNDPPAAREFLENALRRDWPRDDYAQLILRLAEIHAWHLDDLPRARELWQNLVIAYPGTSHADEAQAHLASVQESAPDEP